MKDEQPLVAKEVVCAVLDAVKPQDVAVVVEEAAQLVDVDNVRPDKDTPTTTPVATRALSTFACFTTWW